ncbi:MAG TPA: M48 family metallopeptidase, partial [Candidatus Methylomirabilis sp.]|nr:M48 family metallopeptidase [Candidatus Methylomirabilis sp.]
HRHSTQALIQHTSTGLLVAALTGDMAGPLVYGLAAARVLGQLQYSRHAEAEADDAGMRMLLAARVDPAGMVGFFDELTKGEGQTRTVLSYLSTHPTTADRIARLRALAAGAIGPPVPILSASDWEELKRICSGRGR